MSAEPGLAGWLEHRAGVYLEKLKARGYSDATLKVYRSDLKRIVAYFATRPELRGAADIDRGELMSYAATLMTVTSSQGRIWSAMTRNRHLSTVRGFFRALTKEGFLLSDPASALVGFKQEKKLPAVPSVDDVLRLLAAINTNTHQGRRDRAAVELLYGSGPRISETLALNLDDVDFREGLVVIRCGKGGKGRIVPMVPQCQAALKEYLEMARPKLAHPEERALFVSAGGGRMNALTFNRHLKKYASKAGLKAKVTPHVLRHCCATHLLKGQANLRHIQALLGHSSLSSTQIYTRVEVSDLAEVVRRCHPRENL